MTTQRHLWATAATLALLLATPVEAEAQTVQTRTYVYEWISINMGSRNFIDANNSLFGFVFLEDVSNSRQSRSRVAGAVEQRDIDGDLIQTHFVCNGETPVNVNVVQVGPFAQQATADVEPALPCGGNPQPLSLTLDCPYLGVPVSRAFGHDTFSYSGKYHNPTTGLGGTYTATGQRGPIFCDMSFNGGAEITVLAWLTNVRETRRGQDVSLTPLWWHDREPAIAVPDPGRFLLR